MTADDLAIARYYRRLDGLDPGDPLELIAGDFAFAIHIPGADPFSGGSAELRGYIDQRRCSAAGRIHDILHATSQNGLEVVYGEVVEGGVTRTGTFVAAAETGPDGLLTHYTVAFTPGFRFPASDRLRTTAA